MTTERPQDVESNLPQLDDADQRLRSLYRELAEDPDRANECEGEVRDLHAWRGALAQRVGLSLLARYRAERGAAPVVPDASAYAIQANVSTHEAPSSADIPGTEAIEKWKHDARANGLGRVPYEDRFTTPREAVLDKLMTTLGPPRNLDLDISEELDSLDAVSRDQFIAEWCSIAKQAQADWLGLLVARTRAVKDVEGTSKEQRVRVKTIISRFPPWAKDHRPGHVHGLQLCHAPLSESWSEDARRLWASLREMVAHTNAGLLPRTEAPPKRPRAPDDEDDTKHSRTIDPAWPLWSLVRGRRALVVGGDPREPNRARLERLFEFKSLEWPDIEGPRRTDAVAARIKKRSFDLVVVLQGFVDHKQSEPIIAAAKAHDVTWVLAEGYGATSIMSALERFHSKTCA